MLREDNSKGQNNPDSDTRDLEPEIENSKPAQREMSDLFLKHKELKTKIFGMNSIWNREAASVTFSELCEKSSCAQFRLMPIMG